MCNNPRKLALPPATVTQRVADPRLVTHEPKLQRAKRLIPEWTVYDDEVAALAQRVAAEDSEIGAFGQKADVLEQAVQQAEERQEFAKEERRKDEL